MTIQQNVGANFNLHSSAPLKIKIKQSVVLKELGNIETLLREKVTESLTLKGFNESDLNKLYSQAEALKNQYFQKKAAQKSIFKKFKSEIKKRAVEQKYNRIFNLLNYSKYLDLPNECIQNIFNFMPLKTLVKMGQTNRLTLEQVNYAIITKAKAFGCTQETIQASKEYLKTIFLELKTICDDYKSLNKYAVYKKHLLSKNTLDIEATFNKFITLNKSQNSLKETCANILFKAVEDQKLNSITTLIIAGTPIDLKNSKGDSALSLALLSKKDMKHEIELLLKHHADTNTLNLHKYSPLIIALRDQKDLSIVELLLKNGATKTINHFDEAGYSALHYAAKNGNLEVFNLLVNSGADIFIRKPNEPSIINVAISYSNIEVVKFLIKNRVNLSSIDEGGNTSLMYAVKAENLEVVQLLLDSGSLPTIDFQGTDRYTALHHAAEKENIELVKLLIDRGSNPRILNTAGLRASQMTTNIFIRELL